MIRWKSFILGALTFGVAHGVEVALWPTFFDAGGGHAPWFLNTARAAAVAVGCLMVAGAATGAAAARTPKDSMAQGGSIAAGAFVAMAGVLFATGPGTLFPIVLAFGAAVITASSVTGALAGWALKSALSNS